MFKGPSHTVEHSKQPSRSQFTTAYNSKTKTTSEPNPIAEYASNPNSEGQFILKRDKIESDRDQLESNSRSVTPLRGSSPDPIETSYISK